MAKANKANINSQIDSTLSIKAKPVQAPKSEEIKLEKIDNSLLFAEFFELETVESNKKLKKHKEILTSLGLKGTRFLGNIEFKNKLIPSVGATYPELVQNVLGTAIIDGLATITLPATRVKIELTNGVISKNKIANNDNHLSSAKLGQKVTPKFQKKAIKVDSSSFVKQTLKSESLGEANSASSVGAITTVSFPVSTSYIAATSLSFLDDTNFEIDTNVTDLILIADQIIIANNKKLTFSWKQNTLNVPIAHPNPNDVGENQNGINGVKGNKGSDGNHAPNIEIWTKTPIRDHLGNLITLPNSIIVNIVGQDGGMGGKGQNGGIGGEGKRGEDSVEEAVKVLGKVISYNCASGPKSGENGGRGGNGGDGGNGGRGGDGGKLTFYSTDTSILTNIVSLNNAGGNGGNAGSPGSGGVGGVGGQRGQANGMCANTNWSNRGRVNGNNGDNGTAGGNGVKGINGNPGNIFSPVSINATDYDTVLLNNPGIVSISPVSGKVKVNDSITLNGVNFSTTDTIKLTSEDNSSITIIPSSAITFVNSAPNQMLTFAVPDIPGGRFEVQIINGSWYSNKIHIAVLPTIVSLSKNREKPNQQVSIYGTGFSSNTKAFINSQLVAVQNFINKNELSFTVKRPTTFTPNMDGEIVNLSIVDNYNNASNTINFTIDTYKIIVIGDSIMACQGFSPNSGFTELIRQQIQQNNPDIGVYMDSRAHSGAIISGFNNTYIDKDKEIPRTTPTIGSQLYNSKSPSNEVNQSVELIIMDGGINDLNIWTFLTPEITSTGHQNRLNEITNKSFQYCYTELKNLLRTVGNTYLNAKVVVTGYYQVVSSQSTNLEFVANFISSQSGGSVLPLNPFGQIAFNNVVAQCAHARDRMNADMLQAVNEINTELNTNRFVFVDVAFEEENAIYAPNSFLWELDPLLNVDDPQKEHRVNVCSYLSDDEDRLFCERASTGHPNNAGKDRYFNKIMEVI